MMKSTGSSGPRVSVFRARLTKQVPLALCIGLLTGTTAHAHRASAHTHHYELASPDPDRIFLTPFGDPATTRAVTWRTDRSVQSGIAQIAPATPGPISGQDGREFQAVTEALDLRQDARNQQDTVHYHSVVFNDLKPETLYAYRVGGNGHWSEWIQFRTASREQKPFSFVYFGDAQNNILADWSRVIRMSYQKAPDASLVIHAGDLVDSAHVDNEWAQWFKAGSFIHAQRTGIPAIGNHEILPIRGKSNEQTISMQWRPQFTLPEEPSLPATLQENVYTVDYQGVRFIVLNSVLEVDAQTQYLRQQLERPGAKWTVLVSHYSIFSPRPNRSNAASSLAWKPLLDEYGVDLVLQGHDHLYMRGHLPQRTTGNPNTKNFNTMYVTSCSGPKSYGISQPLVREFEKEGYVRDSQAENLQFFQVIEVDGHQLTYSAYTADGELHDRATLTKDPASGAKSIR